MLLTAAGEVLISFCNVFFLFPNSESNLTVKTKVHEAESYVKVFPSPLL